MKVPYFEDFAVGDDFSDVPAVTLTEGHAALHQAIFADRLRLPLDHELSRKVTGGILANPSLVVNTAIGLTTMPSQRVMGNLFYRGLHLRAPVFIGDTLTTTTKVVALKQNKIKEGRAASGMVALEMQVTNQRDEVVMHFWRCPMIPCRDPGADTGHQDDFDVMPEAIDPGALAGAVPPFNLSLFRALPGRHFKDLIEGETLRGQAGDTVTLAPELVRMTLNLAMTHTDATASVYGKRLVYGGHTIAMAASQLSRVLPNAVTMLAWYHCDHTAPVFEEDILRSDVVVEELMPLSEGGIAKLHVTVHASRGPEAPSNVTDAGVLDWRLAALFA